MRPTTDPYAAQARAAAYLHEWARTLGDTLPAVDGPAAVGDRHRARVSIRRLRVGLAVFAVLYPDGEREQLERQLQRLGRALGAVRTLDVNLARLREISRRPSPLTQPAVELLTAERAARMADLAALQQAARTARLAHRLERMLARPQRRLTSTRLLKLARKQVNDLRQQMRRRYTKYEAKGTNPAFHKLRLALKRYRYAVLAAGAAFPTLSRKRERALAAAQDLMGECQDLAMLRDWVRRQGLTLGSAGDQLADRLKQQHKQAQRKCRRYLAQETSWRKKIKLELEHD